MTTASRQLIGCHHETTYSNSHNTTATQHNVTSWGYIYTNFETRTLVEVRPSTESVVYRQSSWCTEGSLLARSGHENMASSSPPRVQYTPPPSPPSPTASFYDVSDDEEGDYNTITHSPSGRGVKLLFSKSKVRHRNASPNTVSTQHCSISVLQ